MTVDETGHVSIDEVIEGDTVREVLQYVQFQADELLRTMRNRQKLVYVSLNDSWKVVPNELEMIETQEIQRKYV